jgi:cell division topological specificity factor
MSWWDRLLRSNKPSSADLAKERLRIVITHEHNRLQMTKPYLPQLRQELLDVIRRYVPITDEGIQVEVDHRDNLDVLAMTIMLPEIHGLPPPAHQQSQKP